MHNINVTDCKTALARLMDGNEEYINSKTGRGNISEEIRALTHIYGLRRRHHLLRLPRDPGEDFHGGNRRDFHHPGGRKRDRKL